MDPIIEPLRSAGAAIDERLVRNYRVVWMAPMDALLAGKSSAQHVHSVIRDRLANADVPMSSRS